MKCPKCGFISFPGKEECRKCGHHFTQVNGQAEGIPPLFHPLEPETKAPAEPEHESVLDEMELGEQESGSLDVELEPQVTLPDPVQPEAEPPSAKPRAHPGLSPWQSELADRVQEYRQRRARLHDEAEHDPSTLNLDFGAAAPKKQEEPRPHVIEFPAADGPVNRAKPKREFRPAPPSFGMGSFESAFLDGQEEAPAPPPPPTQPERSNETAPLEIELGASGDAYPDAGEDEPSAVSIAQMKMRFFAALIDALVLLSAVGIYALIFWAVGGAFSSGPLELAAMGLVGAFFIMLYFAGCTAMASATPGLLWARLEVITFEGNAPRLSDCLWRGFGYLVSMSAMMLGFIWAVVDAEGLTWHDRMSRTFIVPAERR
ncbi:MAG TPA: RDD family protein [Terriglobia bacterium]|nr:RDD family protein [Terriglobia bacterium]